MIGWAVGMANVSCGIYSESGAFSGDLVVSDPGRVVVYLD